MAHSTLRKSSRRDRSKLTTLPHPGPRKSTIQAILGYSKALQVVDAPPIGQLAVVLN